MSGILYTAGYGNLPPAEFFATLARSPVHLALDARLQPWGWDPLYRGEAFLRALESEGGAQRARWSRRLGNAAKADGGPMRLADPTVIADLLAVLRQGKDVLVICGCRDLARCHRRMIAELAQAAEPQLEVRHLEMPARRSPEPPA